MSCGCNCNVYRRPDGVVGCGFVIEFAGKPQHSVSWPDRVSFRYTEEGLERAGIACSSPCGEPVSEPVAAIVAPEPAAESNPEPPASDAAEDVTQEVDAASEAGAIREYLAANPEATNKQVIAALAEQGVQIQSSQVTREKKKLAA